MIIKVLSFPSGVLKAFNYKPRSFKFYIASKTSSFPLILFSPFSALKSGVTNHLTRSSLFFTTQVIWLPVCSYTYSIIAGFTETSPNSDYLSVNLKVDYPLFIMDPTFIRIRETGYTPHFGNLLTTPVIYNTLKNSAGFLPPPLSKMCSSIFLTLQNILWRLSVRHS